MEIKYDNKRLVEALKDADDIFRTLGDDASLTDEQMRRVEMVRSQPSLIRNVFFLYAVHGATKAAKLLGCSRRYVYKLIKDIR